MVVAVVEEEIIAPAETVAEVLPLMPRPDGREAEPAAIVDEPEDEPDGKAPGRQHGLQRGVQRER